MNSHMTKCANKVADEAKNRLVQTGGRIADEIGLGRVVGEILTYLYFSLEEKSPVEIGNDLGLSKAAVSVAVRQLESLGLIRRLRKKGDRKNYFRTADNIANAIQHGVLRVARQKLEIFAAELAQVGRMVETEARQASDAETAFLCRQLKRASSLRERAARLLGNPLLKLLGSL